MGALTFGIRTAREATGEEELSSCPSCGAELFSDIGRCFECLQTIQGESKPALQPSAARSDTEFQSGLGLRLRTPFVDVDLAVGPEGITLGRSPSNDVVIHSRAVSREHARIIPSKTGFTVIDAGAAAPMVLAGREVQGSAEMEEGQVLDIADASLLAVRHIHA